MRLFQSQVDFSASSVTSGEAGGELSLFLSRSAGVQFVLMIYLYGLFGKEGEWYYGRETL